MLFSSGPCTQGPGMIVSTDKKETLRSHSDVEKSHAKYHKKATRVRYSLM